MEEKNHLKEKRWVLHIFQQVSFFCAILGLALLVAHSFASVSMNVRVDGELFTGSSDFEFDMFSSERNFEDTEVFEEMLFHVLQDVIRYNVLQGQMEVNGEFDGSKPINLDAFANRKSLQDSDGDISYTLEDLLKWGRYGIVQNVVDYSETEFLFAFSQQSEDIVNELLVINARYDGFLTEEQKAVLRDKFIPYESLEEDIEFEKAESNDNARILIESFPAWSQKEAKKTYEEAAYESLVSGYAYDNVILLESEYATADGGKDAMDLLIEESNALAKEGLRNGNDVLEPKLHQRLADTLLAAGDQVGNIYIDPATGEIHVLAMVTEERYAPIDNESMFFMNRNWAEYMDNCSKLNKTVDELSYNYQEYLDFHNNYGEGKTNIQYDFRMTMLGESVEISNMDVSIVTAGRDTETYLAENYRKYLLYNPQSIDLKTNTSGTITTTKLISILNQYEYAYPDDAKIFIGLKKEYEVDDAFRNASRAYSILYRFRYIFLSMIILGTLAFLILFLYLTVTAEGCTGDKRERVWFDRLPTEFFLLITFLSVFIAVLVVKALGSLWWKSLYLSEHRREISIITALFAVFGSSVFCTYWYSFIRRIKGGIFLKSSILVKIILKIKDFSIKVFENAPAFLKTILTLGGIIGFNLVMSGILFFTFLYTRTGFSRYSWWLLFFFLLFIAGDAAIFSIWFNYQIHKQKIIKGIENIRDGDVGYKIDTVGMHGENLKVADAVNSIGDGITEAVETSMKDERLKTDLITNVSHDIKTPLTSIINYVDLIKREKIEEEPVKGYIEILDKKSQRLKQLTDDLVEASKISSGNITLYYEKIDLSELLMQTIGEFAEKFEEKELHIVDHFTSESVFIRADSRRIFRVVENLFQNIYKYAMPGTRVYLDKYMNEDETVSMVLKNISAQALNISADELTERFIRGDISRSTEGSGLGLSIAKNLTELMDGEFQIYLDGDLFRVTLTFAVFEEEE